MDISKLSNEELIEMAKEIEAKTSAYNNRQLALKILANA